MWKPKYSEQKPIPVPLCLTKISHGLAWVWNWASGVTFIARSGYRKSVVPWFHFIRSTSLFPFISDHHWTFVFRLRSHSSLHIPAPILVIISLPTVRPPEFHFRRIILVSLPRYSFIYPHIMQRQNCCGYSYTTSPRVLERSDLRLKVVRMLLSTVTIRGSHWLMQMKYRIWCLCDRASLIQ